MFFPNIESQDLFSFIAEQLEVSAISVSWLS